MKACVAESQWACAFYWSCTQACCLACSSPEWPGCRGALGTCVDPETRLQNSTMRRASLWGAIRAAIVLLSAAAPIFSPCQSGNTEAVPPLYPPPAHFSDHLAFHLPALDLSISTFQQPAPTFLIFFPLPVCSAWLWLFGERGSKKKSR